MKKITWKELDRCTDADAVAELLRQRNIKGKLHLVDQCPLAVATGWCVGYLTRYCLTRNGVVREELTVAETEFVHLLEKEQMFRDLVQ